MKVCSFLIIAMGVGGTKGGSGRYWWMDTDGAFGGNTVQGEGNSGQNIQHDIGGGYQQGGGFQQTNASGGSNRNGYTNNGQQTGRNENRKSKNVLNQKSNQSEKVTVRGKGGPNTARQHENGGKSVQTANGGNNKESPVLPVTQGLVQSESPTSSCPSVPSIPPVSACQGRHSDCWSVGQTDVDCLDNALCCFDGCANVCQGEGARPNIPRPKTNARGQERQPIQEKSPADPSNSGASRIRTVNNPSEPQPSPSVQQNSFQSPANQVNNANTKPNMDKRPGHEGGDGQTSQSKDSSTAPKPSSNSGSSTLSGVGAGLLFPLVSKNSGGYSNSREENTKTNWHKSVQPGTHTGLDKSKVKSTQQVQPSSSFVPPSQVQASKPQNQPKRPKPTSFQQVSGASSKPYIRCPSAMKCVRKVNCDFEGVITDEVLDLSPELDVLRVPLIPCVNRQRGNAVDVCCRDPDHKGPNPNKYKPNNQQQNKNPQQPNKKQQPMKQGSPEVNNKKSNGQHLDNPANHGTNQANGQRGLDNNKTQKRKN